MIFKDFYLLIVTEQAQYIYNQEGSGNSSDSSYLINLNINQALNK